MENKKQIPSWVYQLTIIVVLLITSVLIIFNREQRETEVNILKNLYNKETKKVDSISKERIRERDSLTELITQYKNNNYFLQEELEILEKNLEKLNIRKERKIHKEELFLFFSQRYNDENIFLSEDNNKVTANSTLFQEISLELQEKDRWEEKIEVLEKIRKNQQHQIINLTEIGINLETLYSTSEIEIEVREELFDLCNETNKFLNSEIKTLRKKGKVKKFLLPLGVVIGSLTTYLITS